MSPMREEDLADPDDSWRCVRHPFLTKNIAGYIHEENNKHYSVLGPEYAMIRIYDTQSGNFLGSSKISQKEIKHIKDHNIRVFAKASILCYSYKTGIRIYRVVGEEVKKYKLLHFPIDHFNLTKQLKQSNNSADEQIEEELNLTCMKLLGFVLKTNVLIGTLRQCPAVTLFTVDLDAAFDAKSKKEIREAFSIPSDFNALGSKDIYFRPIYGTDRVCQQVELVGVMRERIKETPDNCEFATDDQHGKDEGEEEITVENGFFVKSLQFPIA